MDHEGMDECLSERDVAQTRRGGEEKGAISVRAWGSMVYAGLPPYEKSP